MEKDKNCINLKDKYEDRVKKIWKKYEGEKDIFPAEKEYRKHALLPDKVHKNRLLFVGINPSFGKGMTVAENEKNIFFYPTDYKSEKEVPYFKKIREVADYCKAEWTHLDLFFIREREQKFIERLTYKKKGIDFLNEQLDISFEIIEKSDSKLIIVSNAFASEFFGKMKTKHLAAFSKSGIWRGFDFVFNDPKSDEQLDKKSNFNDQIGTYEIELNGKKVPILFSGMLSGQRALDLGSLERLKWQAKMILETIT